MKNGRAIKKLTGFIMWFICISTFVGSTFVFTQESWAEKWKNKSNRSQFGLGGKDYRWSVTWITGQGDYGPGDYGRIIKFQNLSRFYKFHVPSSYRKDQLMPIVLVFHGGAGYPGAVRYQTDFDKFADKEGFIAVFPAGHHRIWKDRLLHWNDGRTPKNDPSFSKVDDVGFVAALLDDLTKFFNVDKNRVYATGISNGSLMSYRLACELSDRIAAIAPVGGQRAIGEYGQRPPRAISVMHFHGKMDNWAKYHGGAPPASFFKESLKPVQETIQTWISHNGCPSEPAETERIGKAVITRYGSGKHGSEVVLVRLEDGGHTWPGGKQVISEKRIGIGPVNRDISSMDRMWEFFKRHPMAGEKDNSQDYVIQAIQDKSVKSKVINPEGFKKLKHEFYSMLEEGLHPGAQLAVYYDGELIIHLAGGVKGPGGEHIMTSSDLLDWLAGEYKGTGVDPVTFDTLYQIRSVTKILMMTVMMMLYDQGKLDFDDPVAKYWPEFAKNGKESITIAHVLSHRAGIPVLSHALLVDAPVIRVEVGNRASIARAIENTRPVWKPGEKNGYHGMTIGMVPDEIISRLEGKYPPLGDILRKEVFEPLGLKDIYLGLPPSQYHRMAKMTILDPQTAYRKKGSDFINSKEGIQHEMSWVGGVSTAKDLANFMNIFAFEGTYKGKRFFSKKVQELVSTPTNKAGEIDQILKRPIRWGLGFILGDTPDIFGTPPHPGVIGHVGGGATVAWADPKNKLAVAFLCNGMKNRKSMERYRRVGDLVYGALNLNPKQSSSKQQIEKKQKTLNQSRRLPSKLSM